jgi:hypothetical protein
MKTPQPAIVSLSASLDAAHLRNEGLLFFYANHTHPPPQPCAASHPRNLGLGPELSKNEAPVLVGSNFHIGMGSAEIKDIATAPGQLRITLTDGGAREGGLFIYSKNHLAAKTANGCTVKAVEAVGENVWKIHVEGRQRGKPQNIILEIGTGNDPSKSTLPDKIH